METLQPLLNRYDHFRDFEIRALHAPMQGAIAVTLVEQNEEGEDERAVAITFEGVSDARVLQSAVLPFLDMMRGISIIHERDRYAFAIGRCDTMLHALNAPLYIISTAVSVEEGVDLGG